MVKIFYIRLNNYILTIKAKQQQQNIIYHQFDFVFVVFRFKSEFDKSSTLNHHRFSNIFLRSIQHIIDISGAACQGMYV